LGELLSIVREEDEAGEETNGEEAGMIWTMREGEGEGRRQQVCSRDKL